MATNFLRSFSITEPHPSVSSSSTYIHTGRGGAGNAARVSRDEVTVGPSATGPASRVNLKLPRPLSNGHFLTGRGGAGNVHRERTIFSFDEELRQEQRLQANAAPIYSTGRGGSGNIIDDTKPWSRRKTSASSTMSSDSGDSSSSQHGRHSCETARNWLTTLNRTLSTRN